MGEALLGLPGVEDFRFKIRFEEGEVIGLERIYMDGRSQFLAKTQ